MVTRGVGEGGGNPVGLIGTRLNLMHLLEEFLPLYQEHRVGKKSVFSAFLCLCR